jgi:hypothetical protein
MGLNAGGGWSIGVDNRADGAVDIQIQAFVTCAS